MRCEDAGTAVIAVRESATLDVGHGPASGHCGGPDRRRGEVGVLEEVGGVVDGCGRRVVGGGLLGSPGRRCTSGGLRRLRGYGPRVAGRCRPGPSRRHCQDRHNTNAAGNPAPDWECRALAGSGRTDPVRAARIVRARVRRMAAGRSCTGPLAGDRAAGRIPADPVGFAGPAAADTAARAAAGRAGTAAAGLRVPAPGRRAAAIRGGPAVAEFRAAGRCSRCPPSFVKAAIRSMSGKQKVLRWAALPIRRVIWAMNCQFPPTICMVQL